MPPEATARAIDGFACGAMPPGPVLIGEGCGLGAVGSGELAELGPLAKRTSPLAIVTFTTEPGCAG